MLPKRPKKLQRQAVTSLDTSCPLVHGLNRFEWQVPAAKGPARKGPAKGPPKGKGKSSPRLEEGKEAMLISY